LLKDDVTRAEVLYIETMMNNKSWFRERCMCF